MLEGIFGNNQSFQVNNKAAKPAQSGLSGMDFKHALADLARSTNMTIADKGLAGEIDFKRWRDLEDNLYFNAEEEIEEAALEHLKKLKRLLQEQLEEDE